MTAPRQPSLREAINLEHALEFSYRSHHSAKLDYLCLFRSTALTIKAYFFDEGSDDAVVVPHTHRYDFETHVLCGQLVEARFAELPLHFTGTEQSTVVGVAGFQHERPTTALRYMRWAYRPVVEGGGFSGTDWCALAQLSLTEYRKGGSYRNRAHLDVHTLLDVMPGTVLLLTQYADVGPATTVAYSLGARRPETDGLYERMTRAQVESRIDRLQTVMKGRP